MKIYISSEAQLSAKKMNLFLAGPLLLVTSLVIFYLLVANNNYNRLLIPTFLLAISIFMFYQALKPTVLIIDEDKIILKGALREVSYNLDQFKEIGKMGWEGRFGIYFNDGKSFEFQPKDRALFHTLRTSWKEQISQLNMEITGIIKSNSVKN